jgi:hypothetical protein
MGLCLSKQAVQFLPVIKKGGPEGPPFLYRECITLKLEAERAAERAWFPR